MKEKLPTGRFRRAFDLARVGARAGASWAASRGTDAAAKKSAEVLGNLRGIAAKVGQTASYVDGLIPPEQREAYEKALSQLQRATPPSPRDVVMRTLQKELHGSVEDLFAEFAEAPVASASIGQVHRARTRDGFDVAVKVQHEGIEKAVESDLKNVGMLEGLVNLAGPRGMKAGPILEEVMKRFRAELDYRVEATNQEAFRRLHDCGRVRVPRVISELSSKRVLTTEWVDGMGFDEAAGKSDEVRKLYAETLWTFVFRGNLVGGAFNADPHPGNYIFHDDGGVTFLDFGCVQPIENGTRLAAAQAHRAAVDGDMDAFYGAIERMLSTKGGEFGAATRRYTKRCFEPLLSDGYLLTPEYAASLVSGMREMKKAMNAKDGSFVQPPAHLALMNRLQFGFYSVLARLRVEVDYRNVERTFLDEALGLPQGKFNLT